MKYLSTRDDSLSRSFNDILYQGLSRDGGLYLPKSWPKIDLLSLKNKSYKEVACEIIFPYVNENIEKLELQKILNETYSNFNHEKIAPLVELENNKFLLELIYGPTFAFKDVAMQLLAALLDKAAEKTDKKIIVLGATSGDTGSAAIEACKKFKDIDIAILFPHQKISPVQQRQMTTSNAKNVFPLAVKGDFDDCQNYVKKMFIENDNEEVKFVSINSINWTRIMAQSVYFFSTRLQLKKDFIASIPSGNFGHAYAGWTAKNMGLSFKGINIATNKNDVLHRLFSDDLYQKKETSASLAPSMDISVASNFERLLFEIYKKNGAKLSDTFSSFPAKAIDFNQSDEIWQEVKAFFQSSTCDDKEIVGTIVKSFETENILFDPHTATAIKGNKDLNLDPSELVTFATAHPAKFPDAINKELDILDENTPSSLKEIMTKEETFSVLENNFEDLNNYLNSEVLN